MIIHQFECVFSYHELKQAYRTKDIFTFPEYKEERCKNLYEKLRQRNHNNQIWWKYIISGKTNFILFTVSRENN